MHPVRLVLPLLLALPGPAQPQGATPTQDPDPLGVLVSAARAGEVPSAEHLAQVLVDLGPGSVRPWLRALEPRAGTLDEALRGQLEKRTADAPAVLLARLEAPDSDAIDPVRLALVGLELLAEIGRESDLGLAVALATPRSLMSQRSFRRVGKSFEESLSRILERHPAGLSQVRGLYTGCHPMLRTSMLRALGGSDSYASLATLPRLLSAVEGMDATVLMQITRVARVVSAPLDAESMRRVRSFIGSLNPQERLQAANALGRLDDYDSVDLLIDLLADEHDGVRRNAYWALREITAMTVDPDPHRWRLWFDSETAWWIQDAPTVLANMRGTELVEIVSAINICGSKRLFRRQLTPELVPLLNHPDPMVVRMTCSALVSLRAPEAAPALVSLLDHPDDEVVDQAWRALRDLTGLERLPAKPGPWRAALAARHPKTK